MKYNKPNKTKSQRHFKCVVVHNVIYLHLEQDSYFSYPSSFFNIDYVVQQVNNNNNAILKLMLLQRVIHDGKGWKQSIDIYEWLMEKLRNDLNTKEKVKG